MMEETKKITNDVVFIPDPALMRCTDPELQCGEELYCYDYSSSSSSSPLDDEDEYDSLYYHDETDNGSILFHITLPQRRRLEFNCRDRSCGVLLPIEKEAKVEDVDDEMKNMMIHETEEGSEEQQQHPFFFEPNFSLEAMTGFSLWPGSRFLIEMFACWNNNSNTTNNIPVLGLQNKNVLEVGGGIGAVGTCLASLGGNVLLTDLSVLVQHGIFPNLIRNKNTNTCTTDDNTNTNTNTTDKTTSIPPICNNNDDTNTNNNTLSSSSLPLSQPPAFLLNATHHHHRSLCIPIGKGWARATVLDWYQPISTQITNEAVSDIDIIIGCDCLFLKKLIDPLLDVVSDIFTATTTATTSTTGNGKHTTDTETKFIFSYERRNMMGMFTDLDGLLHKIRYERNWFVECLSWRTIIVKDDGQHELYLFQVTPHKPNTIQPDPSTRKPML